MAAVSESCGRSMSMLRYTTAIAAKRAAVDRCVLEGKRVTMRAAVVGGDDEVAVERVGAAVGDEVRAGWAIARVSAAVGDEQATRTDGLLAAVGSCAVVAAV